MYRGESELHAILRILESQICYRGFEDLAYHYIVGHEGGWYEGVPDTHMGVHAGETYDCLNKIRETTRLWKLGPVKVNSQLYDSLYVNYGNALKLDPDFHNIGILVIGNLDLYMPTLEQQVCTPDLTAQLMTYYDVPPDSVFYHSEIPAYSRSRGWTPKSRKKTCPGRNFGKKKDFLAKLAECQNRQAGETIIFPTDQ